MLKTIDLLKEKHSVISYICISALIYFITFSMISGFIFFASSLFNSQDILTYSEQLALLNKPNMAGVIICLMPLIPLFFIINLLFSTKIDEKMDTTFSSAWMPIKYVVIFSWFIPYAHNGQNTSIFVEWVKYIVVYLAG